MITLDEIEAAIRRVVREELERAEARRRGERTGTQRRHRSPELAARLAGEQAPPVDDVARAAAKLALDKLRRRRMAG